MLNSSRLPFSKHIFVYSWYYMRFSIMRLRRMCDRSALFLLWLILCFTNHPFLNGRRHRSYKSTNWPEKYNSWLNLLPTRRDISYSLLHLRLTYKVAGILLHSTYHYLNKDVLFTICIPRGWMHTGHVIIDSSLHGNLSKRRRMKRYKKTMLLLS